MEMIHSRKMGAAVHRRGSAVCRVDNHCNQRPQHDGDQCSLQREPVHERILLPSVWPMFSMTSWRTPHPARGGTTTTSPPYLVPLLTAMLPAAAPILISQPPTALDASLPRLHSWMLVVAWRSGRGPSSLIVSFVMNSILLLTDLLSMNCVAVGC